MKWTNDTRTQVGYNLFGNKPSRRQGQYETFRSSNLRHFVALYRLYAKMASLILFFCSYLK